MAEHDFELQIAVSGIPPRQIPGTRGGQSNSQRSVRKFPRSGRLLKHADFQRVYERGQRHFERHLTAFYLGRETGEDARVGFTVSRALGGSVQRNRIRRRLREAVRMERELLTPAVDVVFNPKRTALSAEFAQLSSEVRRAFQVISEKVGRKTQ